MRFVTAAGLHPLTDVVAMAVAPLAGSLRDVGCVLRDVCPVPFFGDAVSAKIATVGLNASHGEFEDARGRSRAASRLPTRDALQIGDWAEATDDVGSQIAQACSTYFERNPYRRWFNPLNNMLAGIGHGTLYDGGACHVDLVPWATRPIWGRLSDMDRRLLLRQGRPVLHRLLASLHVEVLLLNGTTVVDAFQHDTGGRLRCEYVSDWATSTGRSRRWWGTVRKLGGLELERPVTVLGWNWNLQSSFVESNIRQSIYDWAAAELR